METGLNCTSDHVHTPFTIRTYDGLFFETSACTHLITQSSWPGTTNCPMSLQLFIYNVRWQVVMITSNRR